MRRRLAFAAFSIPAVAVAPGCIDVDPNWTFDGGTPSYAALIEADGPVAWYRLDETDGAAIIDQMGRYPAVLSPGDGTVEWAVPGAIAGDSGGAIRLTEGAIISVTDPTLVAELSLAGRAPYSVEAWISADSGGSSVLSSSTFIGDPGQQTTIDEGFAYVEHERRDGTMSNIETLSLDEARTGFHYVVATYDGAVIRVYLDGLPATSTGMASSIELTMTSLPFTVAESSSFGDAAFDEIALYDYALSVEQIGAHYRCGSAGDCGSSP